MADSINSFNNLPELSEEFRYGLSNNIPIAANYPVFKYFSLSPTLNTRQLVYFESIRRSYNAADTMVVTERFKKQE